MTAADKIRHGYRHSWTELSPAHVVAANDIFRRLQEANPDPSTPTHRVLSDIESGRLHQGFERIVYFGTQVVIAIAERQHPEYGTFHVDRVFFNDTGTPTPFHGDYYPSSLTSGLAIMGPAGSAHPRETPVATNEDPYLEAMTGILAELTPILAKAANPYYSTSTTSAA